ncbi:MAG: ASPIC/UnbV domain-containing protein [Verrucomicrobiales bacterium]
MSLSPTDEKSISDPSQAYLDSWGQLANRIRQGNSFSGRERHCAFLNTGSGAAGRFADVSTVAGLDLIDDGRGSAVCDWDGDGALDFWVANRSAPRLRLLRNRGTGAAKSVRVLLEGDPERGVNRDAVGARATLVLADGRRLAKSVRIGEGFCSQSSRWLHFGVGDSGVERLIVRWPGAGEASEFSGFKAGHAYTLRQGEQPLLFRAERAASRLGSGSPEEPPDSGAARIFLSRPLPAPPDAGFVDLGGNAVPLRAAWADAPALVMLWASWCGSCQAEIAALKDGIGDLQSAGVRVVALNVDGASGDAPDARAVAAARAKFPAAVRHGDADAALVGALESLAHTALYDTRPLPLPAAFLFAPDGTLRAIYKGPADPRRIAGDAGMLALPDAERLAQSAPLGGRLGKAFLKMDPVSTALIFKEGGYLEDGAKQLLRFIDVVADDRTVPEQTRAGRLAEMHAVLGDLRLAQDRAADAEAAYRAAIGFHPRLYPAFLGLGKALSQTGQHAAAIRQFEGMLKVNARDPHAGTELAKALARSGDWRGALERAAQVRDANPKWLPAAVVQAWIYAAAPDEALIDPNFAGGALSDFSGVDSPDKTEAQAAAFAASGNFGVAQKLAADAADAALRGGDLALSHAIRARAAAYAEKRVPAPPFAAAKP